MLSEFRHHIRSWCEFGERKSHIYLEPFNTNSHCTHRETKMVSVSNNHRCFRVGKVTCARALYGPACCTINSLLLWLSRRESICVFGTPPTETWRVASRGKTTTCSSHMSQEVPFSRTKILGNMLINDIGGRL